VSERVSPGRERSALVAVLAGGRGRRAGGAKALVELDGRPLISYPLRAASTAGLPALVVAKRDSALPALEVPVLREPDHPRHPLCGVVAALRSVEDERRPVLAVGCDMPFLSADLLRWLALRPGDAVGLEVGGELAPLPALYRAVQLPRLELDLARDRPLRATLAGTAAELVAEQELRRFGDPARLCFSVNDANDLALARRWLAQ
jgi:molybdopterin-guanine dinucleotide biosynthesis protein A